MAEKRSMITDLTEGSVTGKLLKFAFPLFASNLLQAVYNVVDMIVVGQVIGGAGMSAVNIGGELLHLLTFLAMGFSSAGQVIISQHVGAGRKEDVKKTIGTMFTFLFVTSIVLSVICYLLRDQILSWLNTPAESYSLTYDYAVTCICGLVFIYGYNIVSAILRGMGDSKRPFVFVAVAAVLNIVLDILFVAGLGMKAYGAALATVIGQGVSFVTSLIYLYFHRDAFGFDFKPSSFRISGRALRGLLALGIPMAIQSAAVNISKIVLTAWINAFGVTMSAVGGLYSKLNTMYGVVSNSFTTAGSAMTGQCIGAEKYDRVPKIMRTNFLVMLAITVVTGAALVFGQDRIFGFFTNDPRVLASASIIVAPAIVNFLGATTRSSAFALINGSGNYKLNLCVAIIDGMIARVGIAYLLGNVFSMGCVGYWYGDAFAGFVPILIALCFYFSGKWKGQ